MPPLLPLVLDRGYSSTSHQGRVVHEIFAPTQQRVRAPIPHPDSLAVGASGVTSQPTPLTVAPRLLLHRMYPLPLL